ncbi:hypothetical protein [Cerasicoccus arenae]|uniref:Uncharacterized protein n=1 Tax=Cerasicoccus arenae TaxID=424488 RepID=A0A8J3DIR2_9BACT|nr:hypothetical protein [Cerasicoccus arenae]MBK1858983.1 hypothetical protein [Cerasicoccus arenae]GHC04240.1 hypothetical protein GCM10007047_21180 [Cerasicoccus arenae]
MEKLTLEPTLHIRFTNDFTAVKIDGDLDDPSSFGLTLMTALRSLNSGAEGLSLGEVKSIRGHDSSEGFQLTLDDAGHNFKKYEQVTQWADFDGTTADGVCYYPVIPAAADLTSWLDQLPNVRWRGLRIQADDDWKHYFREQEADESVISAFSLSFLQLDLLIRSLSLPRQQLQINFAENTLWIAVNDDSDFLLVLSSSNISHGTRATLERCLSFFTWPL